MTSARKNQSQPCGCDQGNLHLHVEIENLKQRLIDRERHIEKMETNFLKEAEKFPNGEYAALMDELSTWQDKYSRLFEAHKRVQKVNQGLEDKLLKMADKCETEKNSLHGDITSLTKKLIEQQTIISKLHEETERYRNDLNIVIPLLQCKPSNFIPQKLDSLPPELQTKVRSYMASKQRKLTDGNGNSTKGDVKTIKVPIPTFPPTAMVYSLGTDREVNGNNESSQKQNTSADIVSVAIMAKILQEREKERATTKHCQTCSCSVVWFESKACQTNEQHLMKDEIEENSRQSSITSSDSCVMDSQDSVGDSLTLRNTFSNKTETSADLIDFGGYNSDDNYECFKTIRRATSNRGEDANKDLISFDSSTSVDAVKGPRLCSVRLQPGSNNILLDNAAQFSSPILYKRRSCSDDLLPEPPTVHSNAKSRHSSQSSSYERKTSTETEI